MSKSIIQRKTGKYERECFICRIKAEREGYYGELPHTGLHKHHFMHGSWGRKKAEHFGLWAYVCEARHHEHGPEAPHSNAKVDMALKQIAQRAFEETHTREEWMENFGKNYLGGELFWL